MKKIRAAIRGVFERDRFVYRYKTDSLGQSKMYIQLIIACAFFLLSIANVIASSYIMLAFTVLGGVVNIVFCIIAKKLKNAKLCSTSAIITCSFLFAFFVIDGGNDGFACLWVVLLPLLSMVAMDFIVGFVTNIFFQVFLICLFWTPLRGILQYEYNEQFCLRFPLFFLVTFALGLLLTILLRKSEYNECIHLIELENMTEAARALARIDPLTKLANRRFAYEEFDAKFISADSAHCIVMGDIDGFKKINDSYGHKFGDEVLVVISEYMLSVLPSEYLKSRWGGEEFLFAANASIDEVYKHIEVLRNAIGKHEFMYENSPLHITITFGIAEYADKNDLIGAISSADKRLYIGKKTKKNCTITEG